MIVTTSQQSSQPVVTAAEEQKTFICTHCGAEIGKYTDTALIIGRARFLVLVKFSCLNCSRRNRWIPIPQTRSKA